MNISITGITGMVGSHLIKRLAKPNPDGSTNNIKALIRETSVAEHLKPFEEVAVSNTHQTLPTILLL